MPSVTKRGGGSPGPWQARTCSGNREHRGARGRDIPVTVKMRIGIDDEHQTYLDAGRMARDEGVAAVALHGAPWKSTTRAPANWDRHRAAVRGPAGTSPCSERALLREDAVRMVEYTAWTASSGRGGQGRPWLFGDLQAALRAARAASGGRARSRTPSPPTRSRPRSSGRGQGLPRDPQARVLVLQGLSRGRRSGARRRRRSRTSPRCAASGPAGPGRPLPVRTWRAPRSRGLAKAAPAGRLAVLADPGDADG
ncbi:tRNA-dihydrouridine synthase [Kocuria rhizophila]|nr:tRNA-dihydrouridine synthase [Kocuria rhizophila]